MKLEFWLDYLSPVCYKQHKRIEELMFNYKFEDFELLYRSFELIPDFNPDEQYSFQQLLKDYHWVSIDEINKISCEIPDELALLNVHDAHRLSHLAKKENLAFLFNKKLFSAFYEDHKDISDPSVLTEVALDAGLELSKIQEVLSTNLYSDSVRLNRENAVHKGIHKLPHLRIDGKIRLSGYHSEKELISYLVMASAKMTKNEYCEGENCERKKAR